MKEYINQLFHGDAKDLVAALPRDSIDLVLVDPPFGVGFNYGPFQEMNCPVEYWRWLEPIYRDLLRVLKPTKKLFIFQSLKYTSYYERWFGEHYVVPFSYLRFAGGGYRPWVEHVVAQTKERKRFRLEHASYYGRFGRDDVWPGAFPVPKPLDQTRQLIMDYTEPNDIVLDCFAGSGTTAVAALQTGRRYISCEYVAQYASLAFSRVKEYKKTHETAML